MDKICKQLFKDFKKELFGEEFCCVLCSNERLENNHYYLCDDCYKQIKFIEFGCEKCGDEITSFDRICNGCKNTTNAFDFVICVCKFDKTAKSLVYKLKYGKEKYVAKTIACFMADKFREVCSLNIDYVFSVPVSNDRIKLRGFNQADLIALKFCEILNLNYCKNAILRIKNTETQTHLTRDQRRKNLEGAFFVVDNIDLKDKTVLIVDDVYTTGATINEIAKTLKNKGASKVIGMEFCHA